MVTFDDVLLPLHGRGTWLVVPADNNCSIFNVLVFLGGLGVAKSV
jgi:hypothetical protein